MSEENIINDIIDIPEYLEYHLHAKINQSIDLAEVLLKESRHPDLKNNILNLNGQNIDMYDYLVINDNLKPGEFSMVASAGQYNTWYVRKTHNNLLQFYHFDNEDNFTQDGLFYNFKAGYKQRLTL
jgi:non-ribosomal peptide synthetase component E (peptide arylation enzyme)